MNSSFVSPSFAATTSFGMASHDDALLTLSLWFAAPFVLIPLSIVCSRFFALVWRRCARRQRARAVAPAADDVDELFPARPTWSSAKRMYQRLSTPDDVNNAKQRAAAAAATASAEQSSFLANHSLNWALRVRIWLALSVWARRWEYLQIVLAFVACSILVADFYVKTEERLFWPIEVTLTVVFVVDYAMHFASAIDRLRFFWHWRNLADLVSLMPIVVTLVEPTGSVLGNVIRTLRVARALRIVRALRLLFKQRGRHGSVQQEIVFIAISFASMLFVFACLTFTLEQNFSDEPSLQTFHDALYWTVQLATTVSFGDIVPKSTVSRLCVALVIVISWLVVAVNLARLIALVNSVQRYDGRIRWDSDDGTPYVVVSGVVTFDALHHALRELLFSSTGRRRLRVVALLSGPPSSELVALSNDPQFESNLQLLVGSPLFKHDLERVRMREAAGVFLLTDKYARDTNAVDTAIILQAIAICDFAPNMRDKLFVHVLRRAVMRHLVDAGISNVLSINELKYGLIGQSCCAPGFSTLMTNLMRRHAPDVVAPPVGLPAQHSTWSDEYAQGCAHQPWSMPLAHFAGETYGCVATSVFLATGATIFAVETYDGDVRRIVVKPRVAYEIVADDLAFYFAPKPIKLTADFVHGALAFGRRVFEAELPSPERAAPASPDALARGVSMPRSRSSRRFGDRFASGRSRRHPRLVSPAMSFRDALPIVWQDELANLADATDGTGAPSAEPIVVDDDDDDDDAAAAAADTAVPSRPLRHSRPFAGDAESGSTVPRVPTSDMSLHDEERRVSDPTERLTDFLLLIVCGDAPSELFVDVLAPVPKDATILVLFEVQPKKWHWSRIHARCAQFSDIHFAQADPLQFVTSCAVDDARQVIVLNGAHVAHEHLKSTFDSLPIIIARALNGRRRRNGVDIFSLAEVAEGRSVPFIGGTLDGAVAPADVEHEYTRLPNFAAGRVFTAAVLDSLICQAFLNPPVLAATRIMIGSTNAPKVFSLLLPPTLEGRHVSSLFATLAARGMLLLGLYRAAGGKLQSSLPYVFANAPPNASVELGDRIFVLADQVPSIDEIANASAIEHFD
jgi:voltage-gated potassium channel